MAEKTCSHLPQYKTLNDHPTLNDELLNNFYGGFIERIVAEIEHAQPPKTIAITGYWGSGKTSALAAVYHQLTNKVPPNIHDTPKAKADNNDTKYIGIWFEAWRYQHEEQPIVALLQAIKEQFSTLRASQQSISDKIEMALIGAESIFSAQIKDLTGNLALKADLKNARQAIKHYQDENLLSILPADKINIALQKAIKVVLENSDKKKLLIFIDDLDRCQHQTALKLLEGIKLHLNIPNCVIVMAVDQAQLEMAVKEEFGGDNQQHFLGVEYLEKLCQDAHRLPLITPEHAAALVSRQVQTLLEPAQRAAANKPSTPDIVQRLRAIFIETRCLPANPRRIKMVINRLQGHISQWSQDDLFGDGSSAAIPALAQLTAEAKTTIATHALAFLVCVQVSYRRIYEQIEWSSDFTNRLIDFCDVGEVGDVVGEDDVLWEDAFAGIQKPSSKRKTQDEHPNDLSVFRPYRIIEALRHNNTWSQGTNSDKETLVKASLKQVLPALIAHYNNARL